MKGKWHPSETLEALFLEQGPDRNYLTWLLTASLVAVAATLFLIKVDVYEKIEGRIVPRFLSNKTTDWDLACELTEREVSSIKEGETVIVPLSIGRDGVKNSWRGVVASIAADGYDGDGDQIYRMLVHGDCVLTREGEKNLGKKARGQARVAAFIGVGRKSLVNYLINLRGQLPYK